jgi:hypothetical protein
MLQHSCAAQAVVVLFRSSLALRPKQLQAAGTHARTQARMQTTQRARAHRAGTPVPSSRSLPQWQFGGRTGCRRESEEMSSRHLVHGLFTSCSRFVSRCGGGAVRLCMRACANKNIDVPHMSLTTMHLHPCNASVCSICPCTCPQDSCNTLALLQPQVPA